MDYILDLAKVEDKTVTPEELAAEPGSPEAEAAETAAVEAEPVESGPAA